MAYFAEVRPEDPFLWPWLGVAIDSGSDGWCATNCCIYHYLANMERFPDPSHGTGPYFKYLRMRANLLAEAQPPATL